MVGVCMSIYFSDLDVQKRNMWFKRTGQHRAWTQSFHIPSFDTSSRCAQRVFRLYGIHPGEVSLTAANRRGQPCIYADSFSSVPPSGIWDMLFSLPMQDQEAKDSVEDWWLCFNAIASFFFGCKFVVCDIERVHLVLDFVGCNREGTHVLDTWDEVSDAR